MKSKILIVEDEPRNMKLIADLLTHFGYEVITADNGADGVKVAKSEAPDLILMDIQLPIIDGIGARRLLLDDVATAGIPVIALTAYAMQEDKENIAKAGFFQDYFTKPIDIRELLSKMPSLIEKRSNVS